MKRSTSCCVPQLWFQWVIVYLCFTALNGATAMTEYTSGLLPKTEKQSALNMHDFIKQNPVTGGKDGKHMATEAGGT